MIDCREDEKKEAILKGHEVEDEWVNRCQPDLPDFIKKMGDCISKMEIIILENVKT